MAVADAELGGPLRIPIELLEAGRLDDFFIAIQCIHIGRLDEHWCDKKHRHMAVIGEDGEPRLHSHHPGFLFIALTLVLISQASGMVRLTRAKAPLISIADLSSNALSISSLFPEMHLASLHCLRYLDLSSSQMNLVN